MKMDLVYNGLSFKQIYFMDNATMAEKLDFPLTERWTKLPFQLRSVTFLFVSVVWSCLVLYLKNKQQFYRKLVYYLRGTA